jgi:hypothetical protein
LVVRRVDNVGFLFYSCSVFCLENAITNGLPDALGDFSGLGSSVVCKMGWVFEN